MKLKTMLFILFLVLTMIPLLVLGTFTMHYYEDKMIGILENDLSVATLTQVEAINHFLEERDINISVISDYETVHQLLPLSKLYDAGAVAQVRHSTDSMLRTRISRNEYLVSASVISHDFMVAACSVPVEPGTVSLLKDMGVQLREGEIYFSPVMDSRTLGDVRRVIVIVKGIYEGGKQIGYFVEEMNLDFFEKVRVAVNLFNNGTIYLVDGTGGVITAGSASDSRKQFVTTRADREDYQRAWDNRDKGSNRGILRYQMLGEHYISYYSGFENAGWIMIASTNADQVLKTPLSYRNLLIVTFELLLLALVFLNYLVTSRLAAPLEHIVDKFQQIKQTQDYSIRMGKLKSKEVGLIAEEIDSLLENVQSHLELEKQKQERLHEEASMDALTGIYNKRAMKEIFCSALDQARLRHQRVVFLYLDVDDFKNYNTEYGHSGGDRVLQFVGQVLRDTFRYPGRIGGDEFAVCLTGERELAQLDEVLTRLIGVLRGGAALCEGGEPVPVYCSIGAAVSDGNDRCEDLLDRADQAMYRVKNGSKNGYLILD